MNKYEFRGCIIVQFPTGKALVHETNPTDKQPGNLLGEFDSIQGAEDFATMRELDAHHPNWRVMKHPNGAPMYNVNTGMMLAENGSRSIFDDVDL
jgi:hypothetical protein